MRYLILCLSAVACLAGPASAENLLWLESGSALPGAPAVSLGLYATHDQPIHAFSAVVGYPQEALEFSGLDLDSAGIVTGEVGYDYSRTIDDSDNGTVIVAVVLDLDPPRDFQAIPASPDTGQLLARLSFSVFPDADPEVYPMRLLINGAGSPLVKNAFTVSPGYTVSPGLQPGELTIDNPHAMVVLDTQTVVGGVALVSVVADHLDPIGGYQVVLRYPSDLLTVEAQDPDPPEEDLCAQAVTFCGLGLEGILGTDGPGAYPIEFFFAENDPAYPYPPGLAGTGSGRVRAAAVFDYNSPFRDQMLPPGTQRILSVRFRVSGSVARGDQIPLTPVNGSGQNIEQPEDNNFTVFVPGQLDFTVRPNLTPGSVSIVDGFRRARVDPGDNLAGLGDAIYLLSYLFAKGPEPPCLDAADSNDDEKLDIGDAVYILGWLFINGAPPPPPFAECGGDPTPPVPPNEDLGCETPHGC
jgi:hypothetical protein